MLLLISFCCLQIFVCVKWANQFSEFVKLTAGVRQGGVLSPDLFAIYVDNLLMKLNKCGWGCHIKSFCFNALMYADDLILLSASAQQLRKLIDLCCTELADCQLSVNINKTACIRIGPKFETTSMDILLNGNKISWKNEI